MGNGDGRKKLKANKARGLLKALQIDATTKR